MDDPRFWALIARLGPDLQLARLAMALRALRWDEACQFHFRLKFAANQLDSDAHRLHALDAYDHPFRPGKAGASCGLVGTLAEFGDLTMTVVALGYDTWQAVRHAANLLAGSWPTELGRQLAATSTAVMTRTVMREIGSYTEIAALGGREASPGYHDDGSPASTTGTPGRITGAMVVNVPTMKTTTVNSTASHHGLRRLASCAASS